MRYGDVGVVKRHPEGPLVLMAIRPALPSDFASPLPTSESDRIIRDCWLAVILSGTTPWGIRMMGPGDVGPVKISDVEWLP